MNPQPDSDDEIKWDIEDLKKAYLQSAEEYDRLMNTTRSGISTSQ